LDSNTGLITDLSGSNLEHEEKTRKKEKRYVTAKLWDWWEAFLIHGNRCWQPRIRSLGWSHLAAAEAARTAHPTLPDRNKTDKQNMMHVSAITTYVRIED